MEPSNDKNCYRNRLESGGSNRNLQCSTEPWSKRYLLALAFYETLDPYSSEAFRAVAKGLLEWTAFIPLRMRRRSGHAAPANKWACGAERCMIRALISCLVERGDRDLADELEVHLDEFLGTIASLDGSCMSVAEDTEETARLVGTVRIQVKILGRFLNKIADRDLSCPGTKPRRKRRKSGPPSKADSDRKLMEQWERMGGIGGMTRSEFCARMGISLKEFIRAQDRHRKRLVAES